MSREGAGTRAGSGGRYRGRGIPTAIANHRREAFCVQSDRQSRRRRTARVAAVRQYVRLHVL